MTQTPIKSTFGDLLRFYRGQTVDRDVGKPLSQEKLAHRISEQTGLIITRNIVCNWENGKSDLHPQKDRFILTAVIAVLYRYRGIKALEEANHLLEAGDYRALDEKEVSTINPQWVPPVPGSSRDLKNRISNPSDNHQSVKINSPITLNIETQEFLPIVVRTPKFSPESVIPSHSLFHGREIDRDRPKDNPSIRLTDKSKVTIQILIAIHA